jgi:hypothetical protein
MAGGGSGAFALPCHSGRIVQQLVGSVGANVKGLGEDVGVSDGSSELQLAVGDVTLGIGAGD